ncbi:hypothetical protein HDU77_000012 [Chytriomyces hyalinus]|nr:hypothetical protein HDU77_000012 [Chytriomyces hyalinus]
MSAASSSPAPTATDSSSYTTSLFTAPLNTTITTTTTSITTVAWNTAKIFSLQGFPYPYNYPTWPAPAGIIWPEDYPFPPPPSSPGAEWKEGDPSGYFPPNAPVPPGWPKAYAWPPARVSATSAGASITSTRSQTWGATQIAQWNAAMVMSATGTATATYIATVPSQGSQRQRNDPVFSSDDTIIIASVSGAVVALLIAGGVLHWLRKRYITLGNRVTKVDEEQGDGVDTQVVMLPPRFESPSESAPAGGGTDAGHFMTSRGSTGAITNRVRTSAALPNGVAASYGITGAALPNGVTSRGSTGAALPNGGATSHGSAGAALQTGGAASRGIIGAAVPNGGVTSRGNGGVTNRGSPGAALPNGGVTSHGSTVAALPNGGATSRVSTGAVLLNGGVTSNGIFGAALPNGRVTSRWSTGAELPNGGATCRGSTGAALPKGGVAGHAVPLTSICVTCSPDSPTRVGNKRPV